MLNNLKAVLSNALVNLLRLQIKCFNIESEEKYLFDIKTFFLHGRLLEAEQIYMEAIPGQGLKSGHINRVVGSLYGHPVAAYRARRKLAHVF